MTSLKLDENDFPRQDGKVAIITGGSSGIGLASACILARKGAIVHVLDLNPIDEADSANIATDIRESIKYSHCDITNWASLRGVFETVGHVDIAIANAGVTEEKDYFADTFDADGKLEEPGYAVVEVNYRAVLNFVKLSLSAFRKQRPGGSLVITSSATAYSPEQNLPVYSATKLGLIGLVRALRSVIHLYGATINTVAPAATTTKLLPADLAKPVLAAGAPVSSAHHVGLAVVHSAVGTQSCQVERYGKDSEENVSSTGRWNGRGIFTMGDKWTELEEPLGSLRPQWFGQYNTEMTDFQQKLTDFRPE